MSDKPDYGKGKTPGHFCVIPQRAVIDPRFKTHPRTFMVLCAIGNFTSRQGVAWPNQLTIAKNLQITQSTVSKHIKLLVKWGYIAYAKKHPGLRGNKYFMIFQEGISEDDAKATATVQDRSFEDKPDIPIGPKQGDKDIYSVRRNTKKDSNGSSMNSNAYVDIRSERLRNTQQNNDIFINSRKVCNEFVKLTNEIYGTLVQYNFDEEKLVGEWLQKGLKPEYAVKRMRDILTWRKDNKYDCPKRIVFYKDVFFKKGKATNKKEEMQRLLKRFVNKHKI